MARAARSLKNAHFMRRAAAIVGLLACTAALFGMWRLPPQHSPLGRLSLEDPIGFFTAPRLAALKDDPAACGAAIAASGLEVAPLADVREGGFCTLSNAVSLERSIHPYSQPVRISCPLAAALYVWEREVLAPAAREHLGAEIAEIEILGTYSCRRIYGRNEGRVSAHATGDAIDVAAFRLADGRRVSVLEGWRGAPAEAAFLRAIRTRGCRVFRAVLSPDYNAAHRDHFHLDMGEFDLCR